jgi:Flp pilus assembly pilin Flp
MKMHLIALLLLSALNSNAIIRKSPTPQLHSMLDKQALPSEKPFLFHTGSRINSETRAGYFIPRRRVGADLYRHKVHTYTVMIVMGGLLSTLGTVALIAAISSDEFTPFRDDLGGAISTAFLALPAAGITMIISGVLMRRKYHRLLYPE